LPNPRIPKATMNLFEVKVAGVRAKEFPVMADHVMSVLLIVLIAFPEKRMMKMLTIKIEATPP
jgi:hypothetical protein